MCKAISMLVIASGSKVILFPKPKNMVQHKPKHGVENIGTIIMVDYMLLLDLSLFTVLL